MDWLVKMGCENVIELDWWEENCVPGHDDVTFVCTPSQHWSKRTALDDNKVTAARRRGFEEDACARCGRCQSRRRLEIVLCFFSLCGAAGPFWVRITGSSSLVTRATAPLSRRSDGASDHLIWRRSPSERIIPGCLSISLLILVSFIFFGVVEVTSYLLSET